MKVEFLHNGTWIPSGLGPLTIVHRLCPPMIQTGAIWTEEYPVAGCVKFRIVDPDFETVCRMIAHNNWLAKRGRK